jgi:regulator of replication initiation timing
VENYNCYASGLNKLCTNSVKQAVNYDFEGFLRKYSGIIYPLFVWSLLLESNESALSELTLPRTKIFKFMMSNNSITQKGEDDFLNEIHESVSQKVTELEQQFSKYSKLLESFKNDLKSRGLIEENTYLFVRGHDIQKFLLAKVLEPISMEKYVAHIESIDQQHQHKAKAKKEFASLRLGLSSLIGIHFEYKSCSFFTNLLKPSIDALLSDLDKTVAC